MGARKLISVVIPAYNEEACIAELHSRLSTVFAGLPQYEYEIILVDNGSADDTFGIAYGINGRDPRFKVIKLTRNFLPEGGIAAGLQAAKGAAAIIMSADLEDPPEIIPEFLRKWEEGFDNVYGVIEKRSEKGLRSFNAKWFYRVIHRLTGGMIPKDVADFRLVDRKLYSLINQMPERSRFLRGLFAWPGFPSAGVSFERGARHGGQSKARTLVVMELALRGITGFSDMPLKLPLLLGAALSALSVLGVLYCFVRVAFFEWFPMAGLILIMSMNLFLFGLIFIILGIMGEYIGMILREVKGRPMFIIDKQLGVD